MDSLAYISRTTPHVGHLFQALKHIIRSDFIPSLTGQPPPSEPIRDLLAQPARLGGLGIRNLVDAADLESSASRLICAPLIGLIVDKRLDYPHKCSEDQLLAKSVVQKHRNQQAQRSTEGLKDSLDASRNRAMELASERGASTWLTSVLIEEFGFCLHKGAYKDALALRYGWPLLNIPPHCVCGADFTVEHVLSCQRGFPIIHHNEIRDVTATLLTEVCHDDRDLQPLSGEFLTRATSVKTDGARLDIAANGIWGGRFEKHIWM